MALSLVTKGVTAVAVVEPMRRGLAERFSLDAMNSFVIGANLPPAIYLIQHAVQYELFPLAFPGYQPTIPACFFARLSQ